MLSSAQLADLSPSADQLAPEPDSDFQSDGDDQDVGRGAKRKRPLSVS